MRFKTIYLRSRDAERATVEVEDQNGVRLVAAFLRSQNGLFEGYPVSLARKTPTGWRFDGLDMDVEDFRQLTDIALELANA